MQRLVLRSIESFVVVSLPSPSLSLHLRLYTRHVPSPFAKNQLPNISTGFLLHIPFHMHRIFPSPHCAFPIPSMHPICAKGLVAFPGAWFSLPSPIPIPDSHSIWFVRSCTCTIRCCITFPPPAAAAGRGRACCCCCPLRSLHYLFPGVPRSSVAYKLPSYLLSHADYQSRFSFLVSSDPKSSRLVSSWLSVPFWFLSSIYLHLLTHHHVSTRKLSPSLLYA